MGLLDRPATKDELLSHETQSEIPAEGEWAKTADLGDDSDPLGPAMGIIMGAVLGGVTWAVILWVLL